MSFKRPIFKRLGCKSQMLEILLPMIPPHKTYVEPFVGSGVLFFNKSLAENNVISDIDCGLIRDYKTLSEVSTDLKKYEMKERTTIADVVDIYHSTSRSLETKVLKAIIRNNNRFNNRPLTVKQGKIYNKNNPYNKLKDIEFYVEKLRKTKIRNLDYQTLIPKYDSEDTFFYLDPPYEESNFKNVYDDFSVIDYYELRDLLKTIKGKFLLSLNFSKNLEEIFGEFNLHMVVVTTQVGRMNRGLRHELLVSNYILL